MDADPTKTKARRKNVFTATLIFLAMLSVACLLAPQTIGEQSRRSILAAFRDHYPDITVTIGTGRLASGVGLVLKDIDFTLPSSAGRPAQRLLHIDELIVETDVTLEKILERRIPICAKRIIAVGVEADLWLTKDQTWSIAKLWPPPKMGPGCPCVEVHDGRLRLYRDDVQASASTGSSSTLTSRPIELDHLRIVNQTSTDPNAAQSHAFTLQATGEFVTALRIEGTGDASGWSMRGVAEGLRIDPTFTSRLPLVGEKVSKPLAGFTSTGDFSFTVSKTKNDPIDFLTSYTCNQGRYEHELLPQAVDDIRGIMTMRPGGVTIQSAQARFGDAQCRVSGSTDGYTEGSSLKLRMVASNLLLNERLAASLPPFAQVSYDKFRPRGHVDVDSRIERIDKKWSADAVAELHGIDINVDKFPYPVSQVIGKVHFRQSQCWSEQLSGRIGSQRINIAFLKPYIALGQASWLRLATDGPITIDSTLLNSLTTRGEPVSKLEKFVRSLSPRGNVNLTDGRWDTTPTGEKSQYLDLRISGGSLRYASFPYPMYDVGGQVICENDIVKINGFTAKNSDKASITCQGIFENLNNVAPQNPEGDWRVGLKFQATDLPLDETIRAALNEPSQRTWDALAPTGVLDLINVAVYHNANLAGPQLKIAAQQSPGVIDNRTVSLRPSMLPYRLDIHEGSVSFDGNEVTIHSLDARHDSTRLAADGRCFPTQTGQWRLDLNVRSGSRLHPDTELVNSLPSHVRGAFQRLQLRGPLSIRGTTNILMPTTEYPDPTIQWGMTVQLEGNRIGDVGPFHDMRGEIMVQGIRDGSKVSADGTVNIDSMHVENKQITAITGPFAIRDDRLLLGETIALAGAQIVSTDPRPTISPIEGRLFGGIASLSGDVLLTNGNFDVTMAIREGDVPTLLADFGETNSTAIGRFDGRVRLEGTVGITHLLKGSGSSRLTGANLYQVPILVQVFNMLSVKPSEKVAFTDGDLRFSVYGDNVTFNQIQLWGDLIALHGSGTMNRSKEVDISFNTRVSPQNGWSHVMRPFGENQYTLWTINVKGPLSNPTIERRALTTVNDTLERMFPGIAMPAQRDGPITERIRATQTVR